MESDQIRLNTLAAASATVIALELAARIISPATPGQALIVTGTARLLAIGSLLFITRKLQLSLMPAGLGPAAIWPGIRRGVLWSLAFGMFVALGFGGLYLAGTNPFKLFSVALPGEPSAVLCFFLVGGVVAPIAEEIYFRGIVYGYLRRWGPVVATMGSTLAFVAVHPNLQMLPLPQIVGGILFAVAYEVEKKLMVPIVIHAAGNLALFSLSLI